MSIKYHESGRTSADEDGVFVVSYQIEQTPDPELISLTSRVLRITDRITRIGDIRLTSEEEAWINTIYGLNRWADIQAQVAMELGIGETFFTNQQGKQEQFTFRTARAGRYNNFHGDPAAEYITELTGNTVGYMEQGTGWFRSDIKDYARVFVMPTAMMDELESRYSTYYVSPELT